MGLFAISAEATPLNPITSASSANSITFDWMNVSNATYTAVLSTSASFTTITDSQTYTTNSKTYFGLPVCTQFHFKVKLSSEADGQYSTPITTTTQCSGGNNNLAFNQSSNLNHQVRVSSNPGYNFQGNATIEFWFRRANSGAPTTNQYFVGKENGSNGWAIHLQTDGTIRYARLAGGGLTSIRNFTSDTNWHHFALTRNSSGMTKMYIDGIFEASNNISTPTAATTSFLRFGVSNDLTMNFRGEMDEMRIWNTERSGADINCLKKFPLVGNESGLASYWDMNEGAGQNVIVKGALFNHGILGTSVGTDSSDPVWVPSSIPNFGAACETNLPFGSILNPQHGSTVAISNLGSIYGTAQDSDSGLKEVTVQLKRMSDGWYWNSMSSFWAVAPVDNAVSGLSNWSMSSTNVNWSTGVFHVETRITDNDLNTRVLLSTFVVVSDVEATPPVVIINSHISSSTYSDNQLTYISGTAADNVALSQVRIRFTRLSDNKRWDHNAVNWDNGDIFHTVNGLTYWNFTMPVSAWSQPGAYQMTAMATDAAANMSSHTINFAVSSSSGGADNVYPTVQIYHPYNGSTHAAATLAALSGNASDNNGFVETSESIRSLTSGMYWNGTDFVSATENFYNFSTAQNWSFGGIPVNVWVNNHTYRLTVRARDSNYNYSYATSDFTINNSSAGDTMQPYVDIYTPVDGSFYSPAALTISGGAGDNIALHRVQVSIRNTNTAMYYDGNGFNSAAQTYLITNGMGSWNFYLPVAALTNGSYLLQARAEDSSGNQFTRQVSFNINGATASADAISPTASILHPSNDGNYSDATNLTNLSGTCNDDVQVVEARVSIRDDNNRYFDGNSWNAVNPFYHYVQTSFNWFATMPVAAWKNGSFTMYLDCRDGGNNITSTSTYFNVSGLDGGGVADTVAPTITVYNPYQNANQNPYSFTQFSGRANDAFGIAQVTLALRRGAQYFDGNGFNSASKIILFPTLSSGTASGTDWSYNVGSYIYTDGAYALEVQANDQSGNYQVMTVSFTVTGAGAGAGDANPPTVGIASFSNGAVKQAADMTSISGTANDDVGLSTVELEIIRNSDGKSWNGASWQTVLNRLTANGLGNWNLFFPVSMWSDGDYIVKARARDTSNRETLASNNLTISGTGSVGGTVPTVGISNVTQGQIYTPSTLNSFNGSVSNANFVRVQIRDLNLNKYWNHQTFIWTDNTAWSTATLAGSVWSSYQTPSYWPNGHFKITVEATSVDNLIASSEVDFFVSSNGGGSDFSPPAGISLTVGPSANIGGVSLSWLSPGDDGSTGTASSYVVKYSLTPITTEADWTVANDVAFYPTNQTPPVPMVAGTQQYFNVNGLNAGVSYFWAIRAADENFNRGPISNSPSVVAFAGCQATVGDGEGTAQVTPSSMPTSTDTNMNVVVTVGNHGITNGGKVSIRIPDGWAYPQTHTNNMSGYITATTSKGSVTLTKSTMGQMVDLVVNGTLNGGDTITLSIIARNYSCELQNNVPIRVLSQATSCGIPTEIASSPTVSFTAGAASWIGFENYEMFVPVAQATAIKLVGKNNCGQLATVANNVNITLAGQKWNNATYVYEADSVATMDNNVNMGAATNPKNVVFPSGQNNYLVYYQLASSDGQNRSFKIQYQDFTGNYTSENYMTIYPLAGGPVLSNISIDSGMAGSATDAVMTPNGDGQGDEVFFNYQVAQNISSTIEISKDNFATILTTLWGYGQNVRMSWNGMIMGMGAPGMGAGTTYASAGNYKARIKAAGATDTSLTFTIQSTGIQGKIVDQTVTAIAGVNVNLYGASYRNTQTLSDGTFEFNNLTSGQYTLHIEKQGYETKDIQLTFNGTNQNLGNITTAALSRIIVNATRSNSNSDLWGSIRTKETTSNNMGTAANELWNTLHFGYGRLVGDSGSNLDKPSVYLKAGTAYTLRAEIPGFTAAPLNYTLSAGETYTWNVSLTPKKGMSGQLKLANGISNTSGYWINISAGIKDPNSNAFLSGYADKYASAYLAPGESSVFYNLLDLNTGTNLVTFDTPGLSPQILTVVMAGSDISQDVTMTKGGEATVNLSFSGDTTTLDSNDGTPSNSKFQVSMRYSNGGSYGFQTLLVNTHATTTSLAATVSGLANGTYTVFFDPVSGFSPTVPGPYSLVMTGGTGSLTLAYAQDSGSLKGTVTLPSGSTLNTCFISVYKDGDYRNTPTITGNEFLFSNLGNGRYNLSLYDPTSFASRNQDVYITNGKLTSVVMDLTSSSYFTISGTVRTIAAPPYDSLVNIAANSTNSLFNALGGAQSVSSVRVQAQLMNADGTVDPLPVTTGKILDSSKLKWGLINTANGAYSIDGLVKGNSYLVSVFDDLNNDGKPDLPRTSVVVSPVANIVQDFVIQKGGDIAVSITSSDSETSYQVKVQLVDAALKQVIQEKSVSIAGTSASTTFSNLQIGSYLLQIKDENSPVKYTAKPVVVNLLNVSASQTASLTLTNSGTVQLAVANVYGTVVTALNKDQALPKNTTFKVSTRGQIINMTFDSADGKYKASILPNTDYDVTIEPPATLDEQDKGKSFLPVLLHARIAQGGDMVDLGIVSLKQGKSVTGTIVDDQGVAIPHVPVLAYQSLAKSILPLQTFTNNAGQFKFENLSELSRYYDFIANPLSNKDSNPLFTEGQKLSVDIKAADQTNNLSIPLKQIKGSIKGQVVSSANSSLIAGYGVNSGRPGASILVTQRNQQKTFEFVTGPDGKFSINMPSGRFDFEFIAKNHQPKRLTSVSITEEALDAGTLTLLTGGASLSGKIRTTDGTLPTTNDITELRAIDNFKNSYRADLTKISFDSVESVDSFVFYGLQSATVYKILALDKGGRVKVLKDAFEMPATDTALDLAFNVTEPKLTANFILKIPERNEIDARFSCNQKFRNKTTADNDLSQFVTVTKGNGTLEGDSFSADRYGANYTYTLGSEVGNSYVEFSASFNTDEINPKTGDYYNVTGVFQQPLGILAQQSNEVNCLVGADFSLPDGAGFSLPAGSCSTESMVMKLQSADVISGVANQTGISTLGTSNRRRGLGAMALAEKLGAAAYPAGMYRAIKALDSTPSVSPFSSFYDIFLPAGVSHVFDRNNKPTLTLKYDEDADPDAINIYYFNEAQGIYTIENTNRRVDRDNHTITIEVGHASIFTVLASSAPIIRGDAYTGELEIFNFPNPFDLNLKTVTLQNPGSATASQTTSGTMIKLSLPSNLSGAAEIKIYNMAGELVRTLSGMNFNGGEHTYVEWDGLNDHGKKVASGVYIGQFEIGSEKRFFKMAVIK